MKTTFRNLMVFMMITTFALTACQPKASTSLEGTSWILVELYGQPTLSDTTITLNLNGDTLTGNDGCNHYGGSYTSKGDSFSIGEDLMGTLMACEEAIMTQASDYTSALLKASKFNITDNRLHLLDQNGNSLAIFELQSQELAGTSWQASFVNNESSEGIVTSSSIQAAQQTLSFDNDGKISGNAGCNNYFANYEGDGNKLSFGAVSSTKMFCGEGLIAEETAFLTALEKASSYRITGDSLQIFAADDVGVFGKNPVFG
ncbi:MAG: META domain-containing protein [Anaerolineaceae bacterium]|nr:META domain-containing protein [Anaerolineaceae bacterium]